MTTRYSELIDKFERLARTPIYALLGIAGGRLIYYSSTENVLRIWSSDLDGGDRRPISGERVTSLVKPKPEYDFLVYGRDTTKGMELTQLYLNSVYGDKEEPAIEMKPTRVIGVAMHEKKIVYTGASEKGVSIFMADLGGKAEELYTQMTLMFASDFNGKYVFGMGQLRGNPRSYEIFRYDVEKGEFTVYTPKEGSMNGPPTIYNGKVLFTSDYEGSNRLYIMDQDRLEPSLVEPPEGVEPLDYVGYGWTYTGRIWYTVNTREGYRTFIDGSEIKYSRGVVGSVNEYEDRIYINYTSFTQPNSIYRVVDGEFKPVIESRVDEDLAKMFKKTEHIWIKSIDGLEIPTYILESDAPKPGPTVIYVHGGPWSHVVDSWNTLIGSLIISGYHVVAPNFRGSTGYGSWFMKLDIGDPGGMDMEDIVAATKYAKESGLADKTAIMGYSYGGFMTFLATVKKPDVWDVGVAGAGIVDWDLSYEMSDMFFKSFIETLFDRNEELRKDRSAIHFVDNLKVPLCIIHPQYDTRTPLKPVLNYVYKLLEKGHPFEMHIIPEMGHTISKIDDIIKIVLLAILFLNEKLKK